SISMAMVCAQLGLRFTAVMPEGVSNERLLIISRFGGEVVFSPKDRGIVGSLEAAAVFAEEHGAFFPRQFENQDNAGAHRFRTAREIVVDLPGGTPDAVVSGVGTGGTLVGLYRGFCDHGCGTLPFAAKPVVTTSAFQEAECSSFSGRIPGVVEGMSKLYEPSELEGLRSIEVPDARALDRTRDLIRRGFPVGPSSGLNYVAAEEAAKLLPADARVVTVFPDRMERYFSTELFGETT
ncbi:MAG: pyridoxal-phosphate dependent enzyme, partial [Planctomycetota bacterium]